MAMPESKTKTLPRTLRLYMRQFRSTCMQYVAVHKKTMLAICATTVPFIIMYWWLTWTPLPTSAITCKSKLAQIVYPNEQSKKKYLEPMGNNFHDLENDFFHFVSTMTFNCHNQIHLGPQDDGGWEVCVAQRYDIQPPCLIYSFGVGNDFRFEKMAEQVLKCEVHAFDPSMGVKSYQYSDNGYFHNIGIDNVETYAAGGRWRMQRLKTIMKELEHEGRTIDYLKMDIEFSEWLALHDMLETGMLSDVRQLVMEVHTPEMDIHDRPDHLCTWSTRETLAFMLQTLIRLKNEGFSLYYNRINHRTKFTSPVTGQERYCCHDLHFVNTRHQQHKWQEGDHVIH